MKKNTSILRAVNDIRADYILESELSSKKPAAPDAPVRTGSKARYIRIAAVAAVVTTLAAVAVIGAGIMKQSGVNPPVVPPIGETQDTETPTEGETQDTEMPTEGETETDAPVLDGSFSTELYSVTDVDGVCYLNFVGGNDATSVPGNGALVVGGPLAFADLDEMYRVLSEGTLTDDMVEQIKRSFRKTEQGFPFPNLQQLHVPVLPEGLSFNGVGVEGAAYYVEFASEGYGITGQTKFVGKESFDAYLASEYTGFTDNNNIISFTSEEGEFSGVPCTVINYRNSVSEMRALKLTIEQEEGRLHVLVRYCLSSTNTSVPVSDKIPYGIRMYYEGADGTYARIVVPSFNREITLEWLQAFGATDYIPSTAE